LKQLSQLFDVQYSCLIENKIVYTNAHFAHPMAPKIDFAGENDTPHFAIENQSCLASCPIVPSRVISLSPSLPCFSPLFRSAVATATATVIAVAVVIVVGFGREYPTIVPMADSEESQANRTTLLEGTQMVARALGIPLEELIFGAFGNNGKSDKRRKQYRGKSS
jgi:hypothetical protein